ncbi:hypothetical protein K461DRAFT_266928 [Myriangium duriaei CBS 260.36]|uniref:Uncharacterized protein n=1 Tax=Myriangium duriaei CBS 260.36 TaxID=1168546 RepID=A0A9P4J1L8_9PEZI|nr:hypothetical protein K461DRAFT_266928 [Myriangium duriaei CBS 260.36]
MDATPTLLLLSLPPSALAGIDLLSFTTTPSFHGLKHLPPGAHLVFTAPHATLALRHGAWFYISPPSPSSSSLQLIVKRWSAAEETLLPVTDAAEVMRHRANLGAIWRGGLAPYRQHAGEGEVVDEGMGWTQLASRITPGYLSRVFATGAEEGWHVGSYSDSAAVATSTSASVSATDSSSHTTGRKALEMDAPLHFIPLNLRQTWPASATGRERTEAARDWSWYLSSVAPVEDVLAEIQFCFLTGLTLNNLAAVEQWRALLRLALGCRAAALTHPEFFVEVLGLVGRQVERLADDADVEPAPAMDGNGTGAGDTAHQELEDKSEAELLAYDLPLRNKTSRASKKTGKSPAKPPAWPPEEMAMPTLPSQDSLASLFLDLEADAEGMSTSFLHTQLVRFRHRLEQAGEEAQPVLRAMGNLEAMLFERFVWEFDSGVPVVGKNEGLPREMDEDDDDDDGEYAPAVVELSQEQMDALGITGVPSGLIRQDGETKSKREEVRADRALLRGGGMSRVVVEDSDSDQESGAVDDGEEEGWDDTVDLEELDARF